MSGCFGHGSAIGHVGEVLQGAVRRDGGVEPFLVTLPFPAFQSTATVRPAETWSVSPAWRTKALRAAQFASGRPLELTIESAMPVGRGCGSSTADCVAAVRAVADLSGDPISNDAIARIAHRAELACDATMFDREPVAFLPRRGEILRRFGGGWPELHIEWVDLGGPTVSTTEREVPGYPSEELDEFASLLGELETAFLAGDPSRIGRVATRSAEIHQRHHPHDAWPALREAAHSEGAHGVAIAHSGTVAAVLHLTGAASVHRASRRR